MKISVAFFAFIIVVVSGQTQRCMKTPAKWKGFFYENNFVAQGLEPYARYATVDYDAIPGDEKIRIIEFEELAAPGRINGFRELEIFLFKEKMQYNYNYNTKLCRKTDISGEFRPFGVLNNAEFTGIRRLGLASGDKLGLTTDHFFYSQTDEDSINHHYSSYWVPLPSTNATCVPVEQHYINLNGPRSHDSVDARFTFLNITTVTAFPSTTFEVPEACRE